MSVKLGKAKELALQPSFVVANNQDLETVEDKFKKFKRRFEILSRVEAEMTTTPVVVTLSKTPAKDCLSVTVFCCEVRLKDTRNLFDVVYNVGEVIFNFTDGESVKVCNTVTLK